MPDIRVTDVASFDDPGRKVVDVAGFEIGIFRLGDAFFAYENKCPHLQGPVCQGKILPLTTEDLQPDGTSNGRVFSKSATNIVCPWHGFEFDIRSGRHALDPRVRLRPFPVKVLDGGVYVTVPQS
jgi:nitrite reductase/ring-hydroxylating ferredoxin subunit